MLLVANKVAYINNLEGWHMKILDEINSKFDENDEFILTLII
jgi:hypothetical protein